MSEMFLHATFCGKTSTPKRPFKGIGGGDYVLAM